MNLTKSDRLTHLSIMIRATVEHTRSTMFNEAYGYICQLEEVANAGGYITPETEEAIGLQAASTDLIRVAKRLLELRNQLIANEQPKLAVVK